MDFATIANFSLEFIPSFPSGPFGTCPEIHGRSVFRRVYLCKDDNVASETYISLSGFDNWLEDRAHEQHRVCELAGNRAVPIPIFDVITHSAASVFTTRNTAA